MPERSRHLPLDTRAERVLAREIHRIRRDMRDLRAHVIARGTGNAGHRPYVSVLEHAAVGDGVADDTASIQAAIDEAPAGGYVYLPPGTYKITAALTLRVGVSMRGAGADGTTTIRQASTTADALAGTDLRFVDLEDLRLEGPDAGTGKGVHFTLDQLANTMNLSLRNVYVRAFGSDGIYVSNCIVSSLVNVQAESNRGHGFHLVGENAIAGTSTSLVGCYANNNLGDGFSLDTMAYSNLSGCASEGHAVDYRLTGCLGITLSGCGSELCTDTSFLIDAGYGNTILGGWVFANAGIGVHVQNTSYGCSVIGLADTVPEAGATAFIKTEAGTRTMIASVRSFRANGNNGTAVYDLSPGTAHLVVDQSLNARFGGNLNVPGEITLNDVPGANLYAATDTGGANPRVHTDQSFYVGNALHAYGDMSTDGSLTVAGMLASLGGVTGANLYAASDAAGGGPRIHTDKSFYVGNALHAYGDLSSDGGLGVNGNQPVYKSAAPTGTTQQQVDAIIAKLQAVGLFS